MGLNAYITKITTDESGKQTHHDLFYFRKYSDLQGWMQRLYDSRHSQDSNYDPEFNCTPVELSMDDVDNLRTELNNNTLPTAHGFFWGSMTEEKYKNLRDSILTLRRLMIMQSKSTKWVYHANY